MSEWKLWYSLDEPNDGEEVFIREKYIHPHTREYIISYRVIMYFKKFGHSYYRKLHENLENYQITHWMRIPNVD